MIDLDPPRRQTGESCRLDRGILEDEHDPEQRIAVRPSCDLKRAQDFLDREILIAIGIERDLPYPAQHVAEARIAAKIIAQDQGVGEQSDQALALDLIAVGDQRSGRDIFVSGVTEQQALEHGEQGHEGRDALVLAQRAQVGRQGFGEFEIVTGTVAAPDLRPWAVGSQRQRGDAVSCTRQ